MGSVEFEIVTVLAGLALAAATFFIGRKTASHMEGRQTGIILTELSHIKTSVGDLKEQVGVSSNRYIEMASQIIELKTRIAALEVSISQLTKRLEKFEGRITS